MNAYAGNGTLSSYDDVLDAKYGKKGTPQREEFHRQAVAYYMGEVLQEARKESTLRRQSLPNAPERARVISLVLRMV